MQLVINSPGSFLKKQNNCFLVKNEEKKFEVSAEKVDSILISNSATITTDAIAFAIEKNIEIVFLDVFGNPYGRIWHPKLGSTTLIRRKQLQAETTEYGFILAQAWINQKITNQIDFLKDLKKNRPSEIGLDQYIIKMEEIQKTILEFTGILAQKRSHIMGFEGIASKIYFEALNFIIPSPWKFSGRSRDPAKDPFNCMLNYGYGVLYGQVERACIIAGLDPYIGLLHTDNYNKKSFVFDVIEMFRIMVDKTVIKLFTKKQIKETFFDNIPGGMTLNAEGKAVLITALNETFELSVNYNNRNVKWKNIIQLECFHIANRFLKEN